MQIKILAEGGEMKPGPALSQKLGPAGINVGQVIAKVNEATKSFKGLKVPVELDVNPSTREFSVHVFSPPVSGLLKKELGIEKGSGAQKKDIVANASIEQIISVAEQKMQNLLAKDLKAAVKLVVGTCGSLGVLVENMEAKQINDLIDQGKYDKEIKSAKTETSPEKKKKLADYFAEVKKQQEQRAKAEAAAQAAKAAEAEAVKPEAGATSTTAATMPAKAEPEKKEDKKKK